MKKRKNGKKERNHKKEHNQETKPKRKNRTRKNQAPNCSKPTCKPTLKFALGDQCVINGMTNIFM